MAIIQSHFSGAASTILVVRVPAQLLDETSALVRDEVSARLPNADGAGLVLDFSEVTLINSIGITCLLQVQDHCRRRDAMMLIAAVPGPIQTFLTQLKLAKRFPSMPTVEEAVSSIEER